MGKYKNISHTKTRNLKNQLQPGMRSLNYLTDRTRYQISRITLSISKSMKQ